MFYLTLRLAHSHLTPLGTLYKLRDGTGASKKSCDPKHQQPLPHRRANTIQLPYYRLPSREKR